MRGARCRVRVRVRLRARVRLRCRVRVRVRMPPGVEEDVDVVASDAHHDERHLIRVRVLD